MSDKAVCPACNCPLEIDDHLAGVGLVKLWCENRECSSVSSRLGATGEDVPDAAKELAELVREEADAR